MHYCFTSCTVSEPNPLTKAFDGNKLLLPSSGDATRNNNLASLFMSSEFRNLPIISPDLSTREDITKQLPAAAGANHAASNPAQMSLLVANQVLNDFSRQRTQPHLVPRPGKLCVLSEVS